MMENSLFILRCVVPACLSVTAVALNALAILALRRTLALPKNFKLLLLSLAVSDVGVGLLIQPMYVAVVSKEDSHIVMLEDAYLISTNVLCLASFIGVTALAIDRFLAINLHLRYYEFVTYNRVVFVVILIWMSSAIIGLLILWDLRLGFTFIPVITFVSLVVIAIFYLKIYLAVKYHIKQIAAMQTSDGGEINEEMQRNAEKQKKAAVSIFCVYLVLVVCYLPNLILISIKLSDENFKVSKYVTGFSDFLVFLNSSLNPLIYCWKMKHIRHAAKNILVKIFSCLSWGKLSSDNGDWISKILQVIDISIGSHFCYVCSVYFAFCIYYAIFTLIACKHKRCEKICHILHICTKELIKRKEKKIDLYAPCFLANKLLHPLTMCWLLSMRVTRKWVVLALSRCACLHCGCRLQEGKVTRLGGVTFQSIYSGTPLWRRPRYSLIAKNIWKPNRITVKYVETNPAMTNRFWWSQRRIYPAVTNILSGRLQQSVKTPDLSRNSRLL